MSAFPRNHLIHAFSCAGTLEHPGGTNPHYKTPAAAETELSAPPFAFRELTCVAVNAHITTGRQIDEDACKLEMAAEWLVARRICEASSGGGPPLKPCLFGRRCVEHTCLFAHLKVRTQQ